jgi:hypothetical protein
MTKVGQTKLDHLYVWTAALLVAHQIDSAYWQEWDLFGMPGGVQAFVLLNVPLVLLSFYGLVQVVRAPRVGARFALVLSLLGIDTFFIHLWFIWHGHPEFQVPASLAILSGALVASLGLASRSIQVLRSPRLTLGAE